MKDTDLAQIVQTVTDNGFPVVLSCLFLWQWLKSQNKADEREEKLYTVIESLSTEIPQIKDRLGQIENDIHDISKEVSK